MFAARLARVEIDLLALEITNLRVLSAEGAARAPGPEASILKIKGTEIQQALSELLLRAAGEYALPLRREAMEAGWQPDGGLAAVGPAYTDTVMAAYLNQRKLSIFGGTNEIQKNLVARMAGL